MCSPIRLTRPEQTVRQHSVCQRGLICSSAAAHWTRAGKLAAGTQSHWELEQAEKLPFLLHVADLGLLQLQREDNHTAAGTDQPVAAGVGTCVCGRAV